jgi:tripartite-type tricarboxylate transporter receptor subunit TctC
MGRRRIITSVFAAVVAVSAAAGSVPAQSFFAGKTMTIIVSTGGDDSYGYIARTFGQHMPRYIPGQPTMIVKAMPGAGNVLATNHLYNIAPKDGTTIGTINNAIPLHQVLDGRGVKYDASKFNWLGSTGTYNSVAYVWHTAGINTIQDAMAKEVILGGTGAGSSIVIYPTVMNNVLGTKFKIVLGYKSVSEINVAMERGEVQARTGSFADLQSEHQDWLDQHKVVLLTQIGSKPDKAIPSNVPLVVDLAKTEEERQILRLIASPIGLGRPYLAPPDVDEERVALLRKAFADTMADKAFLADMAKLKIDIDPVSGDEVARNVAETIGAPGDIVAKAKSAMGEGAASQ